MSSARHLPIGKRLPVREEQRSATQLIDIIGGDKRGATLRVALDGGRTADVILTPGLRDYLVDILEHVKKGEAGYFVPLSQKLTTQKAADLLDVSRPYLIKLLEAGEIPFTKINRHRRIEAKDVFAYKAMRDKDRRLALSEMAADDGQDI